MSTESHAVESIRSVTEILIRTVATHLFALAIYGQFLSLAKTPPKLQAYLVLIFFLCPYVVVGQLFWGMMEVFITARDQMPHRPWPDSLHRLDFYAHVLLRTYISGPEDHASRKVIITYARDVRRRERNVGSWFGTVKIMLCFAQCTQAIGTLVLYARRFSNDYHTNEFDALNIQASILASIAALCSIALLRSPGWIGRTRITAVEQQELEELEFNTIIPSILFVGCLSQAIQSFASLFYPRDRIAVSSSLLGFWSMCSGQFCLVVGPAQPLLWSLNMWAVNLWFMKLRVPWFRRRQKFLAPLVAFTLLLIWASRLATASLQLQEYGGGIKDPWSDKLFVV